MKWIKDGISADETRVSALIIALLVTLGFGMYVLVTDGDITDNLLALLGYEIMAVTGINVAESFTKQKPTIKSKTKDTNVGE